MLSSRPPQSWPKLLERPYGALRAEARAYLFGSNELGRQNNKLHGISHEKRSRAGSATSHTSANNCKLLQRWILPHHSPGMSITHLGLLRSPAVPMLDATLLRPHESALADPFLFVEALHHLVSRRVVDKGGTLDDCHGGAGVGVHFPPGQTTENAAGSCIETSGCC
jgi:hypothetical protein